MIRTLLEVHSVSPVRSRKDRGSLVNYIPCNVGHKLLQVDCCLFKVTSINYNLYYLKKSNAWLAKQRGQATTEWPCQKQVGWFSDHIIHLSLTVKYRSDWQHILRFIRYRLKPQTTIALQVKFSLSTPLRLTGGAEIQLYSFLTSALVGGNW